MSDEAFEIVYDELLNEVLLEFTFQAHKAIKSGFFVKTEKPEDIFGLVKGKIKMPNIVCPKCGIRKYDPTRMASHLSDCMTGNGRASSRKASKKLHSINDESDNGDYENDDLIFPSSSRKTKSKRRPGQANSRKRSKPNKLPIDQLCGVPKNFKKQCMGLKSYAPHTEQQIQSIPVTHLIEPKKEDVQIDVDTVDEEGDVYMSQMYSASTFYEM